MLPRTHGRDATGRPCQAPAVASLAVLAALLLVLPCQRAAAAQRQSLPAMAAVPSLPVTAVTAVTAAVPVVDWRGAKAPTPALTMDRAVALAEQHYRARVVRAAVSDAGGHKVYVLKLLSEQGRVWTVRVDAETGAMN
jgi:hypothetical protein